MVDLLLESLLNFAVSVVCSLSLYNCLTILGVNRSTYDKHRHGNERAVRERRNREEDLNILDLMVKIIKEFGYTPGKGTFRYLISGMLQKQVSERRCGRIMREFHLLATISIRKDPYKGKATHDHPFLSPFNLVNGCFRVRPRAIIGTDITYIYYGPGARLVCYLCIYLDFFTQEVLGWAVSDTMDTPFVLKAYQMMIDSHGTELIKGYTIIHSDGGSQYLAGDYRDQLLLDQYRQSCSRRGTPTDNSPTECFNGLFKGTALLNVERARNIEDVSAMCGTWIEQCNATPRDMYAGLTPTQYYVYSSTGVFPADSYLKRAAGDLIDPEAFLKRKLAAAEKTREKRRKSYHAKKKQYAAASSPMRAGTACEWMKQRVENDLHRVQKLAANWGNAAAELEKNLKKAESVIDLIEKKAVPYVKGLREEQAEELRNDVRKWLEHEPLLYIQEMSMLF